MRAIVFVLTCLLSAASLPAFAQGAKKKVEQQPMQFTSTVASEVRTRLAAFYTINPDCSLTGPTTVRVLNPPAAGTVQIQVGPAYPDFEKANVRHKCNTRQYDLPQVWYASNPGFKGQDLVVVEVFFANGTARTARLAVTVK